MKQIIFTAMLSTCAFEACSGDNDDDEQSASVQVPLDITIERARRAKVSLHWKDNSNNETGSSILLRKADISENIEIAKVFANVTEYTIENGLEEGNIYYFGVRASSATNTSRAVYELYRLVALGDESSITIIGSIKANSTYISSSHQVTNIARQTNVKYGLCRSTENIPATNDQKQNGSEVTEDGKVF